MFHACRHDKLQRLRKAEGRLALLSGGRFLLHIGTAAAAPRPVLLWLDERAACLMVGAPPAGTASERTRGGMLCSRSFVARLGSPADAAAAGGAIGSIGGSGGGMQNGAHADASAWGALCSCRKDELVRLQRLPLAGISSVRSGADPEPRLRQAGVDCLSIASNAAQPGGWLVLQVPHGGNGRARDEWVAAVGAACVAASAPRPTVSRV